MGQNPSWETVSRSAGPEFLLRVYNPKMSSEELATGHCPVPVESSPPGTEFAKRAEHASEHE